MSDLPENWVSKQLGEVCKVVRGITFPASAKEEKLTSKNVCCLRTTNVQKEVNWDDVYFVSKEYVKRDEQFVKIGDVLMSMANSYELVGKVSVVRELPFISSFGAFLSAVRPLPVIDAQYLFHLLRTAKVQSELRKGSSQTVNIANISVSRLSEIEIPLAPLNEQKRIAEKLDSLLARVDSCLTHLERVPQILKRFRQSVLAAATSGRLTKDWREKHGLKTESRQIAFDDESIEIPSHWEDSELYDVINPERPLCYGVVQPGEEAKGGIPLVRIQDLENWKINTEDLRTVSPEIDAEYRRSRIKSGDLLLSVVGTIGRTAIVPSGFEANIARAIARISCREGVIPKWVNIWLSCDTLQWYLSKNSREVARKTLNLSELGIARVALPSSEEQAEIVRRVEKLFAYAEHLEARYTSASEHVERLTPSLLATAFRGELVEQEQG